ncbi:hypothetical protein F2Q70_00007061 [Brassica cretica]|nr:hypothetical protein F2Q70_00007061 [Brassica cretica]
MQLVHFDFNTTPFELHDDNFVLKTMKFCDQPPLNNGHNNNSHETSHSFVPEDNKEGLNTDPKLPQQVDTDQSHHQLHAQPQIIPTPVTINTSAASNAPVTSPPLSGIIKSSVKTEN